MTLFCVQFVLGSYCASTLEWELRKRQHILRIKTLIAGMIDPRCMSEDLLDRGYFVWFSLRSCVTLGDSSKKWLLHWFEGGSRGNSTSWVHFRCDRSLITNNRSSISDQWPFLSPSCPFRLVQPPINLYRRAEFTSDVIDHGSPIIDHRFLTEVSWARRRRGSYWPTHLSESRPHINLFFFFFFVKYHNIFQPSRSGRTVRRWSGSRSTPRTPPPRRPGATASQRLVVGFRNLYSEKLIFRKFVAV